MGAQGLIAVGVPPQAFWLLYVKIAILVLSLIILALAAWVISIFGGYAGYYGAYGSSGPAGFDIFLAIWSFIVYGGTVAIEIWAPHFFYRVGALVGYILSIIFWLSAWAWSASNASAFMSVKVVKEYNQIGSGLAACAGLGALVWILTIVHLAFFIHACVVLDSTSTGQAELGQMKQGEVPPAQYQQSYPAQQPYPGQQVPGQQVPVQQYPAQQPYPTQ